MNSARRHFKGQKLQEFLEEQILAGLVKAGTPILSENQLAGRFSISKLTVRKVIDEFVARGWLDRQQGRGTFVTERAGVNSDRQKARTVLNVVKTSGHLYGDILRMLIHRVQAAGFTHSIIGTIPDSTGRPEFQQPLDVILDCLDADPVAVVCERINPGYLDALAEADRRGIPVVWLLIDEAPFGGGHHLVAPDNEYGACMAVKHLLDLGHRQITLVTHPVAPTEWAVVEKNTRRGFLRAIYEGRIGDSAQIHEYRLPPDWLNGEAEAYFREFLASPDRPTGILVDQDFAATFLVRAAGSLGIRVPEDLAVVGYFDTPWAETYDLTSVNIRPDAIADGVVSLLKLLAEDPSVDSVTVRVKPELIIRSSCGARKAVPSLAATAESRAV